MWPGLEPSCGRLKSEPVMHICGLFYCCSVLPRYVQRATNKAQFHLVPISTTPSPSPTSPPGLPLVSFPHRAQTHLDVAENAERYRSYIGAAFQRNPHGVDDRVLHESEKGMQGETSSLRRILEEYIENSCPWHFFSLFFFHPAPILYLCFRGKSALSGEGGSIEGCILFFFLSRSEVQGT